MALPPSFSLGRLVQLMSSGKPPFRAFFSSSAAAAAPPAAAGSDAQAAPSDDGHPIPDYRSRILDEPPICIPEQQPVPADSCCALPSSARPPLGPRHGIPINPIPSKSSSPAPARPPGPRGGDPENPIPSSPPPARPPLDPRDGIPMNPIPGKSSSPAPARPPRGGDPWNPVSDGGILDESSICIPEEAIHADSGSTIPPAIDMHNTRKDPDQDPKRSIGQNPYHKAR